VEKRSSAARSYLAGVLPRYSCGAAFVTGIGMVVIGYLGSFTLGDVDNGDRWQHLRWSPVIRFGDACTVVALAGLMVVAVRPRLRWVPLVAVGVSLALAVVGISEWHARTYLNGRFRSAFSQLNLGPGFAPQALRFDVLTFTDGPNGPGFSPNAVMTWVVSRPVQAGCEQAAKSVAAWSGAAYVPPLGRPFQKCTLTTEYHGLGVTFTYAKPGPNRTWILAGELDAV
jgi:hypothetical protein